jgi:hypothetical protein
MTHLRDSGEINLKALTSKSSFPVPDGIPEITVPIQTDGLFGRLLVDQLHPLFANDGGAELWHYPKGFIPFGSQVRAKKVGTVADVMLQFDADHHPEARPRLEWKYWLGMLKHSIAKLDLVLTVSQFSEKAIRTFCDRHRIKAPPIVVTYQGVEVLAGKHDSSSAKEDYVIHLANKLSYKGTTWLLEQWSSLTTNGSNLPPLRLVGNLDERATAILPKLKNVSLTPPLPKPELEMLIARSRALLLPSEIEGFGIPAVEAYLLGTPVAFTKDTALEEIIGSETPGGFYRDRDSFYAALGEVLTMDPNAVREKTVQMKARYSWKNCVRLTLEGYRFVL